MKIQVRLLNALCLLTQRSCAGYSGAFMQGRTMRDLILTFFLVTFTLESYAFNDFKCTIKDMVHLEDNGTLNHKSNIVAEYLGREFVVNRQTGIITGANILNTMGGKMPSVYDYLPEENGYKAVTHYKPNNTFDYLQINQYSSKTEKPFFFKGAFGKMFSGTCVIF